jgi:hypothetical protein
MSECTATVVLTRPLKPGHSPIRGTDQRAENCGTSIGNGDIMINLNISSAATAVSLIIGIKRVDVCDQLEGLEPHFIDGARGRAYLMNLHTTDVGRIRKFLAEAAGSIALMQAAIEASSAAYDDTLDKIGREQEDRRDVFREAVNDAVFEAGVLADTARAMALLPPSGSAGPQTCALLARQAVMDLLNCCEHGISYDGK